MSDEKTIWVSLPLRRISTKKAKIAMSIKDIVDQTSHFSIKKAVNCKAQYYHGDEKKMLLVYRVRCGESYSDKSGHKVRVKFDPSHIDKDSNEDSLDVKVSCTCPAFLYWGAQWNLYTRDSLEGQPRPLLQAPTKENRHDFLICKHIKVVADRIGPYLIRILEKFLSDKQKEELKKELEEARKKEQEELKKIKKTPVQPTINTPVKPPLPKAPEPPSAPVNPKAPEQKKVDKEEVNKMKNLFEETPSKQKTPTPTKPEPAPKKVEKKELDAMTNLFEGDPKQKKVDKDEVDKMKNLFEKNKKKPDVVKRDTPNEKK